MLTATKNFKWEMAHMLTGHKGACANVHGHSYKMDVTISRDDIVIADGSSEGMVTDFSDLKAVVMSLVDRLDHAFMYNALAGEDTVEHQIAETLELANLKTYPVGYRPTAENMAYDFFNLIKESFMAVDPNVNVVSVKIWETDTAYAEYRE